MTEYRGAGGRAGAKGDTGIINRWFTRQEFAELSAQHRVGAQKSPDWHIREQHPPMRLQLLTSFLKLALLKQRLEICKQNVFSLSTLHSVIKYIDNLIHARKKKNLRSMKKAW